MSIPGLPVGGEAGVRQGTTDIVAEREQRVEVGRRVAGHIRVAFEVTDSAATARTLAAAGATVIAEATRTPWQSDNARLEGPAGLQLTLFSEAPAPD
jgi:predicted enzyme related to lactoylglutathione lyase